jgi:hypothetical protein
METLIPRYWLVPSRCRLLQQQIMQFGLAGSSTMYAMLAVSAVFRKGEFLPNKFKAVEALNVSLANTKATDDISELLFGINNLLTVEVSLKTALIYPGRLNIWLAYSFSS